MPKKKKKAAVGWLGCVFLTSEGFSHSYTTFKNGNIKKSKFISKTGNTLSSFDLKSLLLKLEFYFGLCICQLKLKNKIIYLRDVFRYPGKIAFH